jgi:hypothetical protein
MRKRDRKRARDRREEKDWTVYTHTHTHTHTHKHTHTHTHTYTRAHAHAVTRTPRSTVQGWPTQQAQALPTPGRPHRPFRVAGLARHGMASCSRATALSGPTTTLRGRMPRVRGGGRGKKKAQAGQRLPPQVTLTVTVVLRLRPRLCQPRRLPTGSLKRQLLLPSALCARKDARTPSPSVRGLLPYVRAGCGCTISPLLILAGLGVLIHVVPGLMACMALEE